MILEATMVRNFFVVVLIASLNTIATAQNADFANVLSYKTTTSPTIDGVPDPGEWDDAGPWIEVNSETGITGTIAVDGVELDPHGGDADSSFRFKTMWKEETFQTFFLFEITDDIAPSEDPREGRLWERDQIEFFMDGTHLAGQGEIDGEEDDDELAKFEGFWNAPSFPETYGKFGVDRTNQFEGNGNSMTNDQELWEEYDPDFPVLSVSNTSPTGEAEGFYIEYGVTLERMFDDFDNDPFADTPVADEGHIVEGTTMKFTAVYSDDDDIDFHPDDVIEVEGVEYEPPDTDRAHTVTYFRHNVIKTNGDEALGDWRNSSAFADLTFTGEFTGVIDTCTVPDGGIAGDLDGDGEVAFADFLTLSANFGQMDVPYADGDIDCDGEVAFADFLTLSANFGQSAGGAAAVPEPSSAMLMLFGLAAFFARRRR